MTWTPARFEVVGLDSSHERGMQWYARPDWARRVLDGSWDEGDLLAHLTETAKTGAWTGER